MKGLLKTALAAAVVAGVAAQPHNHGHGHQHFHAKKHAQSQPEKRNVIVTEVVEGPTVVVYELDGQQIDAARAEKGIEGGQFVVVGATKPKFESVEPIVSTSIGPSQGGQFFEAKTSSSSAEPTSSAAPPPPPPPPPPKPKPKPKPKPSNPGPSAPFTGEGLDREFPSGTLPCSEFPAGYGAIPIKWLRIGGWTTVAWTDNPWRKGVPLDNIHQVVDGGCKLLSMCSYACPPGYQKTQWPEEQGATGQSVGGLWCNADGFLELTRPSSKTLCEPGAGGVQVRSELKQTASICRTDYPGNEMMSIPVVTEPGGVYPLTNPRSNKYYQWQGKPTTAQYYVNNEGLEVEDACVWNSRSQPESAGNWAPTNLGVGKDEYGITYVSIFQNLPTSNAVLNFNIEFEGDFNGDCWLRNGQYAKENGCTIGVPDGKTVTVVLKERE